MSVEVIALILTAAGVVVTLGGGMLASSAWIIKRTDARLAQSDANNTARFNAVDARFDKFESQVVKEFKEVRTEMGELRADLNDVKVAVARLEGPHPRLILPPQ